MVEAKRQNASTTMGFSKNFSPNVNKLAHVNPAMAQEENSPFAYQRGDTSQISNQAVFNKQSFHGDTGKPFG